MNPVGRYEIRDGVIRRHYPSRRVITGISGPVSISVIQGLSLRSEKLFVPELRRGRAAPMALASILSQFSDSHSARLFNKPPSFTNDFF
ncbi:hypothetical protein J6590_045022 [Homalodisca vitripennis]|nr:hypothetical protein J6590_045022 [Homalodisca vitripennis]